MFYVRLFKKLPTSQIKLEVFHKFYYLTSSQLKMIGVVHKLRHAFFIQKWTPSPCYNLSDSEYPTQNYVTHWPLPLSALLPLFFMFSIEIIQYYESSCVHKFMCISNYDNCGLIVTFDQSVWAWVLNCRQPLYYLFQSERDRCTHHMTSIADLIVDYSPSRSPRS